MILSILFHSCESHKHPGLPGIFECNAYTENFYLNCDRIAAIILGIYSAYYYGLIVVLTSRCVRIALICTFISEFKYLNIVNYKWWNIYIYSTLHSIWHILIFLSFSDFIL